MNDIGGITGWTPERRARAREQARQRWADPNFRARWAARRKVALARWGAREKRQQDEAWKALCKPRPPRARKRAVSASPEYTHVPGTCLVCAGPWESEDDRKICDGCMKRAEGLTDQHARMVRF